MNRRSARHCEMQLACSAATPYNCHRRHSIHFLTWLLQGFPQPPQPPITLQIRHQQSPLHFRVLQPPCSKSQCIHETLAPTQRMRDLWAIHSRWPSPSPFTIACHLELAPLSFPVPLGFGFLFSLPCTLNNAEKSWHNWQYWIPCGIQQWIVSNYYLAGSRQGDRGLGSTCLQTVKHGEQLVFNSCSKLEVLVHVNTSKLFQCS